jgi:hypothetical protein
MNPMGGPPPGTPGQPPPGAPIPPTQPPPGQPGYYGPPTGYSGPPGYARPAWAPAPTPSKMGSGRIVGVFVGALILLAVVAGVIVFLGKPAPPVAPCPPGQPCAPVPSLPPVGSSPLPISTPRPQGTPGPLPTPGASLAPVQTPTSNSPVVVAGTPYTDSSLGYGFEYNPDVFTLASQSDGSAVLNGVFFDTQVWVDAKPADTSPSKMIENELSDIDRFLIARVADTDTYDALLGPSIGYIPGQGGVWSGTLTSKDGTPIAPGGVAVVSASDGRITVAVVVIVGTPDARQGDETQEHAVRSAVDDILKTFQWSTQ